MVYTMLLSRLSTKCGIKGKALAWFESYLSDWIPCVGIQGVKSSSQNLKYGVPQGSVLGPKLFSIYSLPLRDIIQKRRLEVYKFYILLYYKIPKHCEVTDESVQ